MSLNRIHIVDFIKTFISGPANSLKNPQGEKAWEEPLVGFSCGDDVHYEHFKADIGSFYWTPAEIFSLAFPETTCQSGDLSVISWVLPQTVATKMDQRKMRRYAAERWARSRNFGEEANFDLARRLVSLLGQHGHEAVAPSLHPAWKWHTSPRYGFASNWSERHAAFVSGLGTFGLCDGLITEKGKAVRCGSVVARIELTPTARKYGHRHAYCLHYTRGTCRKCISRCPAGAIDKNGHNKEVCREYLFSVSAVHSRRRYGFSSYGCGLCQTAVPCESRIPAGCL